MRVKRDVGGDGMHNYLTSQTSPDSSQTTCVTATPRLADTGARIMLEDISHSLHLAGSRERRPLSLQLPGAEMDKGRHTQRDFRHES